jgi:plastocyanin
MHVLTRLVTGVLIAALMGCDSATATDPTTAAPPPDPGTVVVTVGNNFFRSDRNRSANEAVDTVVVGGKVRWQWINTGSAPHNVASIGTPTFTSGPVETGSGRIYELTFTAPGTYRYNCAIHGNLMTGVVVVTAR